MRFSRLGSGSFFHPLVVAIFCSLALLAGAFSPTTSLPVVVENSLKRHHDVHFGHFGHFGHSGLKTSTAFRQASALGMTEKDDGTSSLSNNNLPKLIVFDLDNTLWTPELYQLRRSLVANQAPRAGRDVRLFPGVEQILQDQIPALQSQGVQFAVASRTKSVEWAFALLGQFPQLKPEILGGEPIISYAEIYPGSKIQHFQNLQKATGLAFSDMLFFDDARDGRYGNCVHIAELGCLAVHTPRGLYSKDIFDNALNKYHVWKEERNAERGCIVEKDGSMTNVLSLQGTASDLVGSTQTGRIKFFRERSGFGFINYRPNGRHIKEIFFHCRNVISDESELEEWTEVSFVVQKDQRGGKLMATDVKVIEEEASQIVDGVETDMVSMKCFSMNLPFAALLANEYKTLETRNGTMFAKYAAGTKMLLHVGRRIYPDGNKHLEIMTDQGLSEKEIEDLKALPSGFRDGSVIAILELGRTYETSLEERSERGFQQKAGAYGEDSGRFATEIRRVSYLKSPVTMKGQPGVFKVRIPADVLPDDWDVSDITRSSKQTDKNKKGDDADDVSTLVASISG